MNRILLLCLVGVLALSGCQCSHRNVTAATCEKEAVCEKCNEIVAPALGHNYITQEFVAPTCTEEGKTTYICTNCNDIYSETIGKIEHTGEEIVLSNPTLAQDGEKQVNCNICGQTVSEIIPKRGMTSTTPYEISAPNLYNEILNGKFSDYNGKYLAVSGNVTYISDYGDLKGYYLHGTIGQGVVCWVDDAELIANTGASVVFIGKVQNEGIDHVELTECTLQTEIDVTAEPGLSSENPIPVSIDELSTLHTNKWVSFSGTIAGTVEYGEAGTWYYLDGDVACLSNETHSVGDTVNFIGKCAADTTYWTVVVDCSTIQ